MVVALEQAVAAAVELVGSAVVGVRSHRGVGSGLVVADGVVVTNAHNLSSEEVEVTDRDGEQRTGRVIAADLDADLGVVAVATPGATPPEWRAADTPVTLGVVVVALADPAGRGLRATIGTVSAVDRAFRGPRGRRLDGGVEHTAPLPRGSSGGPLVDARGRLVGLNTARLGDGFYVAVPADEAMRERLERLRSGEVRTGPRLGLAIAPTHVARRLRAAVGLPEREGLLVHAVEDGSPAALAGLSRGDLLVRAGDTDLVSVDDLHRVLDATRPGAQLELGVVRGVEQLSVVVGW